jgi:hypothetical protein
MHVKEGERGTPDMCITEQATGDAASLAVAQVHIAALGLLHAPCTHRATTLRVPRARIGTGWQNMRARAHEE